MQFKLNLFFTEFDPKYVIRHYKKTLAMYSYIWDILYTILYSIHAYCPIKQY